MTDVTHENWSFEPVVLRDLPWHEKSEAPPGIPVLDVALMGDTTRPEERTRQLATLREAVTSSGFFYVENHGIPDETLEAIANATRRFYALPEAFKERFHRHEAIRGYTAYRFESTARFFGAGVGKDLCMKYTMGPELTPEEIEERITTETDRASNAYSENVYPDAVFRTAWVEYYAAVEDLSRRLLELLGEAIELDEEDRRIWTEMLVERSGGELRFLQYPDVPLAACSDIEGNTPDRMGAHFDMSVITVLHQTPCANGFVSLEAKYGDTFHEVPAIRGTLVVNLGEILRLLTGGRIRATVHRAVRPPVALHRGSARDVTVFFQAPPLNALLRPIRFGSEFGEDTLFDAMYAGSEGPRSVRFSHLRAEMFGRFLRQSANPSALHEADGHLFRGPEA
ncbi:MAG: isopenicillin N synthase family oxygenase [Alphaproteobacteria bacterium]|nr:isopenicillin N synthase family oxygenase [Alphaproteobacteria bacterium]